MFLISKTHSLDLCTRPGPINQRQIWHNWCLSLTHESNCLNRQLVTTAFSILPLVILAYTQLIISSQLTAQFLWLYWLSTTTFITARESLLRADNLLLQRLSDRVHFLFKTAACMNMSWSSIYSCTTDCRLKNVHKWQSSANNCFVCSKVVFVSECYTSTWNL